MKFYVSSAKYRTGNDILRAYPNITNYSTRYYKTSWGDMAQELSVELNTAEDFIRFSEEINNNRLIIDAKDRTIKIYDYWVE